MYNNILDKKDKIDPLLIKIHSCEKEFTQLISNRLGIIITDYQIHDMNKAIYNSCHQLNCTPQQFLNMLINCRDDSPLLEQLIASITVGETYFFRDAKQMQLLREVVIPKIIKSKREENNLTLRIWSAGCATGEEIYTIAILLIELLNDINKWNINLLGTDINTFSLKKAMAGVYSEWSTRVLPDEYKKKYFSFIDNQYHLHPYIKNLANFLYLNLNADSYPSMLNNTNANDLVLCRNVLIYFDNKHIAKLMQKMDASLVEGGFLLLGASDPINIKNTHFKPHPNQVALLQHHVQLPTQMKKHVYTDINNESTKSLKIAPSSTPTYAKKMTINSDTNKIITTKENITKNHIVALLNATRWQEVLDRINAYSGTEIESVFLLNAKATALANLGQLDLALKACYKSLEQNPINIHTHFMLAMILAEQNRINESQIALNKALFLDHQFVAGHFQLGLLLIRKNQKREGIKSLKNALTITLEKNSNDLVEGFKDLKYGHLAEILQREIELYSTTGSDYHANTTPSEI